MQSSSATLRGSSADVRWSYRRAAALGPWEVHIDPAGARLTAAVVSQDAFAVSQRPLTFLVRRPTGQWVWPIVSLQIVDGTLTASLGPQE